MGNKLQTTDFQPIIIKFAKFCRNENVYKTSISYIDKQLSNETVSAELPLKLQNSKQAGFNNPCKPNNLNNPTVSRLAETVHKTPQARDGS